MRELVRVRVGVSGEREGGEDELDSGFCEQKGMRREDGRGKAIRHACKEADTWRGVGAVVLVVEGLIKVLWVEAGKAREEEGAEKDEGDKDERAEHPRDELWAAEKFK